MSILSESLRSIKSLLFPPICPVCGGEIPEGGHTVCTLCRYRIPLTGFWRETENPLFSRLWGQIPVEQASAFIWFARGSGWQNLIHSFKYGGAWRIAREMGVWYGSELKESGLYDNIDVVVPIPLHWRRLVHRGYNQSLYIAEGIASQLGVGVDCRSVVRRTNNRSQTSGRRSQRWDNVSGIFGIRHPKRLAGKHILLVDDVFTTGSTVISCAEEILRYAPDSRISIAALAVSQHELGMDK